MVKILLVSDVVKENKNYISRLKQDYEVDDLGYIQTALYKLKKEIKYDLVIIEVGMSSHGLYTHKETSDGLRTGLVFYEREIKQLNIPVIFWSWDDQFNEEISKIDSRVTFVERQMDENHLLLAVKKFIAKM